MASLPGRHYTIPLFLSSCVLILLLNFIFDRTSIPLLLAGVFKRNTSLHQSTSIINVEEGDGTNGCGTELWSPGSPGSVCELTRIQAAFTSLFIKVVSHQLLNSSNPFTNNNNSSSDQDELEVCPFSSGMDVWAPLKYAGRAESMFQSGFLSTTTTNNTPPSEEGSVEAPTDNNNNTFSSSFLISNAPSSSAAQGASFPTPTSNTNTSSPSCYSCAADISSLNTSSVNPTQKEVVMMDRMTTIYSIFREELLTSLSVAPMTYFSDSCGMSLPLGVIATCLTAATLSATNTELAQMTTNASNFNLFTSIERFRTTLCAHTIPCNVWRTGYWGSSNNNTPTFFADEYFGENEQQQDADEEIASMAPFKSLFTATVSPSNPHSQQDIRRLRNRRVSLSPWKSIQLTHPRYRAIHVDGNRIEFNVSRGVFTSSAFPPPKNEVGNNNNDDDVRNTKEFTLGVSPRKFFHRIINISRSLKRFVSTAVQGGREEMEQGGGAIHRHIYQQLFPSIIIFQGDSLHRGLMYSSVQRLREISLRSSTYSSSRQVDNNNMYDDIPPVPSAGTQGQSIYFMYPGVPGSGAGMVDVIIDRAKDGGFPTTDSEKITFLQQRRICAEALRNLILVATAAKNETRANNNNDAGRRSTSREVYVQQYIQQLVIKFLSSPMTFLPPSALPFVANGDRDRGIDTTSLHNATYALKALLPCEALAELVSYAQIICGAEGEGGGGSGSKISGDLRKVGHYCPVVIMHYIFHAAQQHPLLDLWSAEALNARKVLQRQLLTKKERGRQLGFKSNPLFSNNRVGLRLYGSGVWKNKFADALVNAASFSSDVTDPPITINRLTTTHSRCCRRESCAYINMQQQQEHGAACSNNRLVEGEEEEHENSSTMASSLLGDNCGSIAPSVPFSTLRNACDAIPDDWLRYEHSYTDKLRTIMAAQYPRRSRKAGGSGKVGPPKTLLQFRGEVVKTAETNLRSEAYARALMLIWESATTTNSSSSSLFLKWCQSQENEGALSTDFTLRSGVAAAEIQSLCSRSKQVIEAIGSVARHSTTHFYDALLMRSLSPFGSTDVVHSDCSMQAVLRGKRDFAHLLPAFLKSLPRMYSFPNNSLQALATNSQSMCRTPPTIDASGLATLLFFKFPTHFSEVEAMGIRAMQDSIPSCLDGSMDVGLPVVVSDDLCRSTSQRSEVNLIFGPLTDNTT